MRGNYARSRVAAIIAHQDGATPQTMPFTKACPRFIGYLERITSNFVSSYDYVKFQRICFKSTCIIYWSS
jgi:hypothetical protein